MRTLTLFLLAGLTLTFGASAHAFTTKQMTPKIRAAIKHDPTVPPDLKKGLKISFDGKGQVRSFVANNFKLPAAGSPAHPAGGDVEGTVDMKLGTITIGDHIAVEFPKAPVAAAPVAAAPAAAAPAGK